MTQTQTNSISNQMRSARRLVVLTGAGVSAESGVPTFRGGGNSAVWKGMPFDVISSAQMVERDLPAVWE
jgi:NAD-dependent SIR2 family protein deacetylase